MWVCKHCREQVDDAFNACWNCGTDAEGARPDQPETFQSAREEAAADEGGVEDRSTSSSDAAPGTRILLLPGERLIRSLRLVSILGPDIDVVHLTTHRLMLTIQEYTLGVFPAGTSQRVALLGDIDSAGVTTRRLPAGIALIGLVLLAAVVPAVQMGGDGWGLLLGIVGGVFLLGWLLIRRALLVFTVAGDALFEMAMVRAGPDDTMVEEFIQALFRLKTRQRRARA